AIVKETFRLVRGFGFFSVGFALGDRFSKYVVTSMKFSDELSLPDNDPVKIKTKALITELSSSKGANAETANTAISLFLSEVLFTKASVLPKYYSIMKELNKRQCKITYNVLQDLLAKNLAQDLARQSKRNWLWRTFDPRRNLIIFMMQAYIDELIVSKILFTEVRKNHKEKIEILYKDLASEEIKHLMSAMLEIGNLKNVESDVYKSYGGFVVLEDIVKQLQARPNDVKCCLDHLASVKANGQLMASACMMSLFKNILEPSKNQYICEDTEGAAKMASRSAADSFLEGNPEITPAQKKIIENGQENLEKAITTALKNMSVVELIEEGQFKEAKEKMLDNSEHDAGTVQTLIAVMDDFSNSYKGMTVQSGLSKLEALFVGTYPAVIPNGPTKEIQFKKDVLAAIATATYIKLKAISMNYKKDGLVGEDYLQARLYQMLQSRILFLNDTFPPYKDAVYKVLSNLGLAGIKTNKYGGTEIEAPEKLMLNNTIQEDSVEIK
ncbi:MAG: hypothetical protein WCQ47_07390, partial [bacterium]